MLNLPIKIVAVILFTLFSVAFSPICATLGDTEQQERENNKNATSITEQRLNQAKFIVFSNSYGNVGVLMIDGIAEIEIYSSNEGDQIVMAFSTEKGRDFLKNVMKKV